MALHIVVRIAAGEKINVLATALVECAAHSRAEPGCREYRVYRATDGVSLLIEEEWGSQTELDQHIATPHFQTFKVRVETTLGKKMEEIQDVWFAEPLD